MNLFLATLYTTVDDEVPDVGVITPVVIPVEDRVSAMAISNAIAERITERHGVDCAVEDVEALVIEKPEGEPLIDDAPGPLIRKDQLAQPESFDGGERFGLTDDGESG